MMEPLSRTADVLPNVGRRLRRLWDFVELGKPRLMLMVLVTTGVGYYMGAESWDAITGLAPLLLGTALSASGALALNQYMEREVDARMPRTSTRPLPAGRLTPGEAFNFGFVLALLGLVYLAVASGWLVAVITATTILSYLLAYTPLKLRSPMSTIIGAIPGALPPVAGWAAARGEVEFEAGILFAILFLWQLPHALAIAELYRDDYARAGIQVLPVVEHDAGATARQMAVQTLVLAAVALLPWAVGMTGRTYAVVAASAGGIFAAAAFRCVRHPGNAAAAKALLFVSLAYLPVILLAMALDRRLPLY